MLLPLLGKPDDRIDCSAEIADQERIHLHDVAALDHDLINMDATRKPAFRDFDHVRTAAAGVGGEYAEIDVILIAGYGADFADDGFEPKQDLLSDLCVVASVGNATVGARFSWFHIGTRAALGEWAFFARFRPEFAVTRAYGATASDVNEPRDRSYRSVQRSTKIALRPKESGE